MEEELRRRWKLNPNHKSEIVNHDKPDREPGWHVYIEKFYSYVIVNEEWLNPGLKADDLCKEFKINHTYFCELIKYTCEKSGIKYIEEKHNFRNFLNYFRVEEAMRLMREQTGYCKMKDIMGNSGFNCYSTFSRVFKEMTGMSPKDYRNKQFENWNP